MKMQKKLRRGYTTGSCAAAASAAAVRELCYGIRSKKIEVQLPIDKKITIQVFREDHTQKSDVNAGIVQNETDCATYSVIKDAGDDPDVTNHIRIDACASWCRRQDIPKYAFCDPENDRIFLDGGEGVGRVTEPGLEQSIGQAAINKVPRRMIFDAIEKNADLENESIDQVLLVVISAENGEKIAKKTFNEQIGIVGGISILGTTGIVEPMSTKALIATIELETKQQIEQGYRHLLYVPGNYGERYVKNQLSFPQARPIECSNYIGEAIDLAAGYGAKSFLLVGNFGKLVKLAAGIMNTHSRVADGRWEILAAHAALAGATKKTVDAIRKSVTTDQMLTALKEADVYEQAIHSTISEIDRHVRRRADKMAAGIIIFSEKYGYLGATPEAEKILALTRQEIDGAMNASETSTGQTGSLQKTSHRQ